MQTNIGEILKEGRKRAGLNQEELARRIYCDQAIISKIETGAIPQPSYALVKQWAKICKCEDLISFDIAGERNAIKEFLDLKKKLKQIGELVSMMRVKRAGRRRRHEDVRLRPEG